MCRTTATASTPLPSDPSAPRLARRFLRGVLCPDHRTSALPAAELLVSEVVTNAVLHGRPPLLLEVDCESDAGLRVRVSDGSPVLPRPRHATPVDVDGRGMDLVAGLALEWGVRPLPAGKEVWFVVSPDTPLEGRWKGLAALLRAPGPS